ncbi:hypothetical protein [Rhizobium gallicum]|uniref:hypothetical protein n=1 Tax=Rhizobium gallicum TaxID=56730 RepID=UPI001EF8E8CB|nr:hypothetical protein [Rhizobium gallicum]ULJ76327.1 hypothetical protein L2W42_28415 [Rhizobium gallicum]
MVFFVKPINRPSSRNARVGCSSTSLTQDFASADFANGDEGRDDGPLDANVTFTVGIREGCAKASASSTVLFIGNPRFHAGKMLTQFFLPSRICAK